jgi:hypothetical protein
LVAEGFDYPTIGAIMGISDYEARRLQADARKRLMDAPTRHYLPNHRAWNTAAQTMHYADSLVGLGPKKAPRPMPWTGFLDVARERIYLRDILTRWPHLVLVTHWKNHKHSLNSN